MKSLGVLALVVLSSVVGCGGSSSEEESDSSEGALSPCISLGFIGKCFDTGAKTAPQGWPIPKMVLLYSDHFEVPSEMLSSMEPLKMNPNAVGAEIHTSSADSQGITCTKDGAKPSCSFSILVEASTVKDEAGALVPFAYSQKPVNFAIHGRVAELFLKVAPAGTLGPLSCKKTERSAECVTKKPFPSIVNPYEPNNDTSKALAEASLEPPATR